MISVEAPHLRQDELLRRLEVSEGTAPGGRLGETSPFEPGSRIARVPWRAYAFESGLVRLGAAATRDAAVTVAVVRFPEDLLSTLRQLDARRRKPNGDKMVAIELLAAVTHFVRSMSTSVGWTLGDDSADVGISTGEVGLPHTTIDTNSGRHVGLHLDSWDRLPPGDRGRGTNRICMNSGLGPRRLLFVPKPASVLIDELASRGFDVLRDRAAAADSTGRFDLARRYLEVFPDQPVLRICVLPGESYIAPTENLIHDGSSEGGIGRDVSVTMRGRFVPV
jgi:hypothetical protein